MRTTFITLLIWAAMLSSAQLPSKPGLLDPAGLRRPGSSSVTYLLNETFNATGYDVAGWTESSSTEIKEDYATAPAPLSGTQSLYFDVTVNRTLDSGAFTSQDTVWVSFLLHDDEATLPTSARAFMALKDSVGGSTMASLTLETDGDITVACGTSTNRSSASISLNTTYRVWVSYTKGTGANGQAAVYWVTPSSGDKGTAKASVSNGSSTGQIASVRFVGNPDMEWHLDDVQVAASEF